MRTKLESLQLQLDFEEIMNDDQKIIQRLTEDIRDLKLRFLLNEIIKEEDEKEYFE